MKPSEIRELSDKERGDKIKDLEEEYFNLKFQVATGKIENPGSLRHVRRDIARIKTIQRELNSGGSDEAEAKEEPKEETVGQSS